MRRRILLLVIGMTVLVVLAFAVPLAIVIRHNAYDDGMAGLRRDAIDVSSYLRAYQTPRTTAQIRAHLRGYDDYAVSVQLPNGTVLGTAPPGSIGDLPQARGAGRGSRTGGYPGQQSAGASTSPGGSGFPFGGGQGPANGFDGSNSMAYADGQLIQIPTLTFAREGSVYTVRSWASDSSLRSGETGPWLLLAGASVLLVLIGIALGELLTRRIVRPLLNTADTAQRLAAGDVTARATTSGPGEVAEVGHALNRLADRIDQLIAEERETVADLSHRLRTPLTALRLDAEALRDESDAERIGGHVTTLERMLTAVIRAARRPQREGRMPSSDATAVVSERVAFWSALAEDQGRAVQLVLPERPTPVRAADEDLGAALDALLENVIAHTPEGTPFAVRLVATERGARLEVSDDGPGLPDAEPVRGRSDRGSSGLGLDIARRCAEASGGSMTLGTSPAGGASITLELLAP